MSNEQALAILRERRGTMYDPAIVDVFVAAHDRIMPEATSIHPAAEVVGRARGQRPAGKMEAGEPAAAPAAADEVLGVGSLARALSGQATTADVGALFWMMLRTAVPCTSMGLFAADEASDTIAGQFAAGAHADVVRALRSSIGDGIVGWVAANRRHALNAEPALDFGPGAHRLEPPLASSLVVPLLHEGTLVAVLSVYSHRSRSFTEDHASLLELMAPQLAASLAAVSGPSSPERRAASMPAFKLLRGRRIPA
jgi:putative methionine-R-sulfoxide reductase with GAF domain